jgi:RNA polymerase sigma-70 factor, ECF subfamily
MINYYKEVFSYVKKNIFDKEIAQDITQETFARVIKKADNSSIDNERALLYRVAKNIMVDLYRKKSDIKEISFNEEEYISEFHNADDRIIQDEQQQLLIQEIDKLPKKRRQAFTLHIIQGYSRKEVSQIMGISFNAVEQHISRASNQIKQNISKKEGTDFE